jgi:AraC-like DNA-binding protein
MKPYVEKVPITEVSFLIKEESFQNFDVSWHIHPEYELAIILKGQGRRNVGNSIDDFYENEIILLGPNLPHSWYSSRLTATSVKQIIVQFSYDFLGKELFEKPEFGAIKALLTKAHRGIVFKNHTNLPVKKVLLSMLSANGFNRTISLLNILNLLAKSTDFKELSLLSYSHSLNETDSKKINKVFRYILDNFRRDICLSELASLSSMTPPAFCNYFKKHTKKTYTQFLNDVRIGHACKLIIQKNLSISQICSESGFNNLSNFNRQFKKVTNSSPTEYKNIAG